MSGKTRRDKLPEKNKYHSTQMQREVILKKLREQGCRITKQRMLLLDIILQQECTSCKEIIFQALKRDKKIGSATVYRMINALEEIGAVSRNITYPQPCIRQSESEAVCTVELDDKTVYRLDKSSWNHIIEAGLGACGYLRQRRVTSIKLCPGTLELNL